jgi:hypothetical protein
VALASIGELSEESFDLVLGDSPVLLGSNGLAADDKGHGDGVNACERVHSQATIWTPCVDSTKLLSGTVIRKVGQSS